MKKNLDWADVYDIDKKTGALILGSNRLDDYAKKYLSRRCPEALVTPMPLPIDKILEKEGLTVKYVTLSKDTDIFGCCLLIDDFVNIYDGVTDKYHKEKYSAGTILIDSVYANCYDKFAQRNTLIHEALHWEKDRKFFEILKLSKSALACPIMCRKSLTFYEPPLGKKSDENTIRWLEWQAHRLTPRILMPFEPFKQKAEEMIQELNSAKSDIEFSCGLLVKKLSNFFEVSQTSVKYRIEEVGLLDKIIKFEDYEKVFEEIHTFKDYVPMSLVEAYELFKADIKLRKLVETGKYIFVEGYFVKPDLKYISFQDGEFRLTKTAKKDIFQCAIDIHGYTSKNNLSLSSSFKGSGVLCRSKGGNEEVKYFRPVSRNDDKEPYDEEKLKELWKQASQHDDDEKIFEETIRDTHTTLCDCLKFWMEIKHWKYAKTFSENTLLEPNYYNRIQKNKYNNMGRDVLMAICVGLKLTLYFVQLLFDKSDNKLRNHLEPDRTYIRIISTFPGLSIDAFNTIMQLENFEELGSKSRK